MEKMEARLTNLEVFALDTRDRLARIETRLDTFATKDDLKDLSISLHRDMKDMSVALHRDMKDMGISFHKDMNAQTWTFIRWMTSISAGLVAVTYFIARNVH